MKLLKQHPAHTELERILSSFSRSYTTPMEKTSTLPPQGMKVIITLEASGNFLSNVTKVCTATGLSIEQIFEHISQAIDDRRNDQHTQSLMVNGRYPDTEQTEIFGTINDLIEAVEFQTGRILGRDECLKLLKVLEDDDAAIVEITPEQTVQPIPTRTMHPRKRKMAKFA